MNLKAPEATNGGTIQQSLERGVDKATAAAHESVDSVSGAAHPAIDHMTTSAHAAVSRAGVVAGHAAETAGGKGDQLNAAGQKLFEQAGGYVRENPLASLGIAVAAGYFLSRILSPR